MLEFNFSPYFDDFKETRNFYRILFKPGFAVQSRELTQSQHILQQQLTYFGDSIYQHGSQVIPGGIATDPNTAYVLLNPTFGEIDNTPIPINLALFTGQIIQGSVTGIQAQVVFSTAAVNSDPPTLFVKYLTTGVNGQRTFVPNENLFIAGTVQNLAQVQAIAPTGLCISAQINEGVYYVYGIFVLVEQQYILLNKYSNTVSCRVGLLIDEEIVTWQQDATLLSNAQGSYNYAAPGADRYQINLVLSTKLLTDTTPDTNFIELVRLVNSVTQLSVKTDTYSVIETELAQRMADTNGDFTVRNFQIDVRECLDTSFVTTDTAQGGIAGPPSTITLAAGSASPVNGTYVGNTLYISNGTGAGQTFTITNYVGSTKVATLDEQFLPNEVADSSSVYLITNPALVNRGVYPPPPFGIGNEAELAVGMESGRAYVDGYLVNTLVTDYVITEKARDSAFTSNAILSANAGNYLFVKNVFNMPLPSSVVAPDFLEIALSNKKASGSFDSATDQIGTARVHAMEFYQGVSQSGSGATATAVGSGSTVTVTIVTGGVGYYVAPTVVLTGGGGTYASAVAIVSAGGVTGVTVTGAAGYSGNPTVHFLVAAVWKLYLFDIQMNSGQTINTVRSFYLTSSTNNNNGDSLNSYGDVCAQFGVTNVNGTNLVVGKTLTGPNGVGTELIVSFDPINNFILTEPAYGNGLQILTAGTGSVGSTTVTINSRTQLYDTANGVLIYYLPQSVVSTVTDLSNSSDTTYFFRQIFEATRNGSGQFIFTSASTTPFYSFDTTDYLACIVASSNSEEVGAYIDLYSYITSGSFSGSPADTTLTITIPSGLGSTAGCKMKLMATLIKSAQPAKLKTLTTQSLSITTPTTFISLDKADVYQILHIWDSGNPSVAATGNSPDVDIINQYRFDTGQRDFFYDVGAIQLLTGAPGPIGQLLVVFQYFEHSGTSDFFSVDSYTGQIDYSLIPIYTASNTVVYKLRDCLDFRPRAGDTIENFSSTGSSYSSALKPNSIINADFQYYLPRIDKIYCDQYGNFNLITGISALVPKPPPDPVDGMMLYTIALNAYTLSPSDLNITATNNRRYTMSDIAKLDQRITNLEYYTALNLLEQQVSTTQIISSTTGLNAFQNGFVADTFIGHNVGNIYDTDYKCSVDPTSGSLRPPFIQNNNELALNVITSSGFILMSEMAMLPFTNLLLISQPYATGTVNVNPFAVFTFNGSVVLDPNTDSWIDVIQLPVINNTDNTALIGYTLNQWSQVQWGSWQTVWVGTPTSTTTGSVGSTISQYTGAVVTSEPTNVNLGSPTAIAQVNNNPAGTNVGNLTLTQSNFGLSYGTYTFYQDSNGNIWNTSPDYVEEQATKFSVQGTTTTTTQQIGQVQTGTQTETVASVTSQNINNVIIDTSVSPYIRSRRIKITATHLKPFTQMYPFFDGVDVSAYCRPYSDPQFTPTLAQSSWITETILWGGDYSPQDNANVDISSIESDQGKTATYTVGSLNAPIFTDASGTTTLFFEIPCNNKIEFKVGTRVFLLTDNQTNAPTADSWGQANYTGQGVIEQNQETITSIETPVTISRTVSQTQTVTNSSSTGGQSTVTLYADPLAESFLISNPGGVYITKVDLFFATADSSVPITLSIRAMSNGTPSQTVVPFSTKTLYPNNPILSSMDANGNLPSIIPAYTVEVINTSTDASVPTSFYFDCPVYLNDSTEYSLVLEANSINYTVYVATLGGTVIGSNSIVSKTPYLGSFFESQNSSTWVPDPTTNLKFNIWRATFNTSDSANLLFNNSTLIPDTLGVLPFQTKEDSNLVRVLHPNHGMPKGQFANSMVTLSNIPIGTYNGLTNVQLSGNFVIDNVDLDSYTITTLGTPATGTGFVGPDGVTATKNVQYDSICLNINEFEPTGTNISWAAKGTTGKSPNNNSAANQQPYVIDAAFSSIQENITQNSTVPYMICSPVNEQTNLSGNKSFTLEGILSTTAENLTPMIDISRINAILINTRLDDPTFFTYTIESLDAGVSVLSSMTNPVAFASHTILTLVGVTGGQYETAETVIGAVSGTTGVVVSWDGTDLTLDTVSGQFMDTEALTGETSYAIGTISSQLVVNTITDTNSALNFGVFTQGYVLTIAGSTDNPYPYNSPVVILATQGNVLTVDTSEYANNVPFVTVGDQTAVVLQQYNRFVAETGPDGCTHAARYLTKQISLATPANSLQIYFDINLPSGSFVDVYYRVQKANISGNFNDLVWTLVPLTGNPTYATNYTQFYEFSYSANEIGSFSSFAVKIVMRGGNSSLPPQIQNFRALALTL